MKFEEWRIAHARFLNAQSIDTVIGDYAQYYHAEMSKWVSVEDALPIPFTQEVLVWCKYGTEQPLMAWYNDKTATWHVSTECTDAGDEIERHDGTIRCYAITHWQPLPTPPHNPTPERP